MQEARVTSWFEIIFRGFAQRVAQGAHRVVALVQLGGSDRNTM